ncbi:hypothetical protein DXG03_000595, partial [Asterophora parasitica]
MLAHLRHAPTSWFDTLLPSEGFKHGTSDLEDINGCPGVAWSWLDGESMGKPTRYSFVNDADAVAAVQSAKDEPIYLLDRNLRVDFAQGKRAPQAREPTHSLYFHGFRAGEEALRQATRSFESSIINVYFRTCSSQSPLYPFKDRESALETGSGFIHFMSVERATETLNELHGANVGDEVLFLQCAYPKNEDGDRRGG